MNLKRVARKQGIKNPFQISMAALKTRLEVCEEEERGSVSEEAFTEESRSGKRGRTGQGSQ